MGLDVQQAAALGVRLDPRPAPDGPFSKLLAQKEGGKARHRKAGRTAQRRGADAEDAVIAACEAYDRQGLADVAKHDPGFTVLERLHGAEFRGRLTGKGGCDFSGQLHARGDQLARPVTFEVKRSSDDQLPLRRHGKPTLAAHQLAQLERRAAGGGIAGVLVRLVTGSGPAAASTWWWIPAARWRPLERAARAAGRKYLTVADLDQHARRCPWLRPGVPDWLAAALCSSEGGE